MHLCEWPGPEGEDEARCRRVLLTGALTMRWAVLERFAHHWHAMHGVQRQRSSFSRAMCDAQNGGHAGCFLSASAGPQSSSYKAFRILGAVDTFPLLLIGWRAAWVLVRPQGGWQQQRHKIGSEDALPRCAAALPDSLHYPLESATTGGSPARAAMNGRTAATP